MDNIMEASRMFFIGEHEFEFEDNDGIFWRKSPLPTSEYHNTHDGCNTCKTAWQKTSDLQNSHCDFCGVSNCKSCMKKTRAFYTDPKQSAVSTQLSEPQKGRICKLCDRKFFIKAMVWNSGK